VAVGREAVLTIKATGRAPELARLTLKEGTTPLQVTLKKGQVLRGQLVDGAGNPVTVGRVFLDTWRGARTLVKDLELDDQGKFSWDEAPADEIKADILAPGYRTARKTAIQAGKPNVIVMKAPTLIRGTVVDAQTGAAVPAFKVELGEAFREGEKLAYLPGPLYEFVGTEGKFVKALDDPKPRMGIRIEAEGYLPADSGDLADDGAEHAVAFKLRKSGPIAGVVRTPEGKAAVGESVYQVFAFDAFELLDGKQPDARHPHTYRTVVVDKEGKYSFPATTDPYALVIYGEAGYAILTPEEVAKSADVNLQKYARVEGTLKQGTKVVAEGIVMMAQYDLAPEPLNHHLVIRSEVKTDGAGHFVVEKVVAGQVELSRKLPHADGGWDIASDTRVVAKAGETMRVDVGGVGRPVVGKVELPAEMRGGKYALNNVMLLRDIPIPARPLPEEVMLMTWEERAKWREAFAASEAGKAFDAQQRAAVDARGYRFGRLEADGLFRFDDVPAGAWVLTASFVSSGTSNVAARVNEAVNVEVPGGVMDEPLDIGVATAKAVQRVAVGAAAPDFAVTLADGSVKKLADYRGKPLVLAFWSAKVGLGEKDIAALKELAKKQREGGEFALLVINADEQQEMGRKFAEKFGLGFTAAYVGDPKQAEVAKAYEMEGYPRSFLIGETGQIVETDKLAEISVRVGAGKAMLLTCGGGSAAGARVDPGGGAALYWRDRICGVFHVDADAGTGGGGAGGAGRGVQ
jgi:peroxiredoxin